MRASGRGTKKGWDQSVCALLVASGASSRPVACGSVLALAHTISRVHTLFSDASIPFLSRCFLFIRALVSFWEARLPA
jgi:hypothetical protein